MKQRPTSDLAREQYRKASPAALCLGSTAGFLRWLVGCLLGWLAGWLTVLGDNIAYMTQLLEPVLDSVWICSTVNLQKSKLKAEAHLSFADLAVQHEHFQSMSRGHRPHLYLMIGNARHCCSEQRPMICSNIDPQSFTNRSPTFINLRSSSHQPTPPTYPPTYPSTTHPPTYPPTHLPTSPNPPVFQAPGDLPTAAGLRQLRRRRAALAGEGLRPGGADGVAARTGDLGSSVKLGGGHWWLMNG